MQRPAQRLQRHQHIRTNNIPEMPNLIDSRQSWSDLQRKMIMRIGQYSNAYHPLILGQIVFVTLVTPNDTHLEPRHSLGKNAQLAGGTIR